MINQIMTMSFRINRNNKARLKRYCMRNGLVLNHVINEQLQPLLDRIEREEAESKNQTSR